MKYLSVYITPFVVCFALYSSNLWSYFALVFVFVLVPLLDLFTQVDQSNLSATEEALAKTNRVYDWILYGLVPMQYFILVFFLLQISSSEQPLYVKIGWTTAYGIACGVLGINAAHELGHRSKPYEKTLSKMLLFTSLYLHFYIEHNRGHHKNVATFDDPASSRKGESVYAFYFRSITKGWVSAWKLEAKRLNNISSLVWSSKNQMLVFQLCQFALLLFIFIAFGIATTLFYFLGALTGIILLETVNYIEHYGLQRHKKGEKYERTLPAHSWNSNHPVGRLLLLELSRHSDHHYMASKKYQLLEHHEDSPQMPTGYPGMMLLALVPPLWFFVVHRQLQHFYQKEPIN